MICYFCKKLIGDKGLIVQMGQTFTKTAFHNRDCWNSFMAGRMGDEVRIEPKYPMMGRNRINSVGTKSPDETIVSLDETINKR